MDNTDKTNIHKGHRSRLREQYENFGADSLEDHRLLELLLFNSIPRGDTNPIAHRLLDRFGSIFGVLKASQKELMSVKGIGKVSAAMIRTVSDTMKHSMTNQCLSASLDSEYKIKTYVAWVLFAEPADTAAAIFTDSDGNHLHTEKYPCGVFFDIDVFVKRLTESANKYASADIIIAHTHAGAAPTPSAEDINTTIAVSARLKAEGKALAAHYIASDLEVCDILPACTNRLK